MRLGRRRRRATIGLRGLARSPLSPALVVLLAYGCWVFAALHFGHNIRDFADVGSRSRAATSDVVPAIHADARYAYASTGYDGQYYLALARAPTAAAPYLNYPQFIYSRIVYPMLARGLALGRQSLIPAMLLAVNVLAVSLTALALSVWLSRRGRSPWLALLYAFYPGVFVAVQHDLTEPLSYCLAAFGIVSFDSRRGGRIALSAALFALAALTRESAALLAVGCAYALLARSTGPSASLRRRALAAAGFLVAVLAPYAGYRVFLSRWLGGSAPVVPQSHYPFEAVASYWFWVGEHLAEVYAVVTPSVLVGAVAAWALVRGFRSPELLVLIIAVAVFVVFAPRAVFSDVVSVQRSVDGVALATILALPALDRATAGRRTWLWLAVMLWFSPWWQLLPFAFNSSWA